MGTLLRIGARNVHDSEDLGRVARKARDVALNEPRRGLVGQHAVEVTGEARTLP